MLSGQDPVVMVVEQASTQPTLLTEGVGAVLAQAGIPLLVQVWGPGIEAPPTLVRLLATGRVRAVVVTALRRRGSDRELDALLRRTGLPRLQLGIRGPGCTVRADNALGARLLATHLVHDCGSRRVLIVNGLAHQPDARDRGLGLREALLRLGLPADRVTAVNGRFERTPTYRAVRDALRRDPGIDAVAALNDRSALGALDAVAALGRTVPDDVVVTGFDDEEFAGFSRPSLTTVSQDLRGQGVLGGELLVRILAGREVAREIQVPVRLRVRGSSARGGAARYRAATDPEADARRTAAVLWDRVTGVDVLLGINRGLMACGRTEEVVHRLAAGLPRLGVARAYLVLREPGRERPRGVLALSYRAGHPARTSSSAPFDLDRVLPEGVDDLRHGTLAVHPLDAEGTELGYLLLDLGGADPGIGEALRTDLSRALETVRSTDRLREHSHRLELEVASRRAAQRALVHQATYDGLTGLVNRAAFLTRADELLGRGGANAALILVDLHRFKDVNDALGHAVGDGLLCEMARRLSELSGDGALVGRLAGDEFAVLVPGAGDPAAAGCLGRRIVAALRERVELGGLTLEVDGRVGIACSPQHAADTATLLRMADLGLHAADLDTGGIGFFEPGQQEQVNRRLAVFGELRRGLAQHEFAVHYQPIVTLASGEVSGVEALVRWLHPTRGLLLPGHFIDVAEQTGLIDPLGSFVLERALRDCRRWHDHGMPLKVSVNLSARQLGDLGLPHRVGDLLDRYDVPASALVLEITESAAMVDPDRALTVLHALRRLGTDLAVDDFGTGHASLTYLTRLPVTGLKIDRSFVQPMGSGKGADAIVRSIVRLAADLELEAVAEGVETGSAYAALGDFGCTYAQGFWLARPTAAADVPGLVTGIRERLATLRAGSAIPAPRRPADVPGTAPADRDEVTPR